MNPKNDWIGASIKIFLVLIFGSIIFCLIFIKSTDDEKDSRLKIVNLTSRNISYWGPVFDETLSNKIVFNIAKYGDLRSTGDHYSNIAPFTSKNISNPTNWIEFINSLPRKAISFYILDNDSLLKIKGKVFLDSSIIMKAVVGKFKIDEEYIKKNYWLIKFKN